MNPKFTKQAALLLRIIPVIAGEKNFALQGGTAINLFLNEMPRISIDIDLTWIPYGNRTDDIEQIILTLSRLKERLLSTIPGITVSGPAETSAYMKLFFSIPGAIVKVEVNTINRGIIDDPIIKELCFRSQYTFNCFCEMQIVPVGQLYGGKIIAALDRQHPRDLFDVKKLFESVGFTKEIYKGFIFCLLSSNRPIHEILNPARIDQQSALKNQMNGMTDELFTYEIYESVRDKLKNTVMNSLTNEDKSFLISFTKGIPDWNTWDYSRFPGVQWKLMNINKLREMNLRKYNEQINRLEYLFSCKQP